MLVWAVVIATYDPNVEPYFRDYSLSEVHTWTLQQTEVGQAWSGMDELLQRSYLHSFDNTKHQESLNAFLDVHKHLVEGWPELNQPKKDMRVSRRVDGRRETVPLNDVDQQKQRIICWYYARMAALGLSSEMHRNAYFEMKPPDDRPELISAWESEHKRLTAQYPYPTF